MAFITKPSFVLHTLLLYAYSLAIVVACNFHWRAKSPPGRRLAQSLKPLAMLLVPVACMALPYYALNWQDVAEYIWRHSRGDSAHLWRLPTGYLGSMVYYFTASALSLLTFGISRIGNPYFGLTSQVIESLLAIYFVGAFGTCRKSGSACPSA